MAVVAVMNLHAFVAVFHHHKYAALNVIMLVLTAQRLLTCVNINSRS